MRTPEQIAADDRLTAAIEEVARAYDVMDEGELVMDFAIVGYAQGLDDVGERSRFVMLYKDNGHATNSTPYQHEGLLREGIRTHLERIHPDGE